MCALIYTDEGQRVFNAKKAHESQLVPRLSPLLCCIALLMTTSETNGRCVLVKWGCVDADRWTKSIPR